MPSSYTDRLRLNLQASGENANTWGNITNVNIRCLEDSIAGLKEINTTGGDVILSTNNVGADYAPSEDQARYAILKIIGTLTSNANIIVPNKSKTYIVWNATNGSFTVTVKTASSTGQQVTQGKVSILFCDGSDVYKAFTDTGAAGDFFGTPSSVDGEVVLFQGTSGKQAKRANQTGIAKLTSGVLNNAVPNVDYQDITLSLNNQTGTSYTFVASDAGKYIRFSNAAAISVTVPPNSSVSYPVGTQLHIRQVSTGQVTIVPGSGVTINTNETLKLRKQGSSATLIKIDTNTWDLMGDLEAAP